MSRGRSICHAGKPSAFTGRCVKALFARFAGIAFLRYGPEHLPGATFLVVFAAALHFAVAIVSSGLLPQDTLSVAIAEGIYVVTAWIAVRLLLIWRGHEARANRTLSALFGAQAVIQAVRLPVMLSIGSLDDPYPVFVPVLVLFVAWSVLVMTAILRSAAGVGRLPALALTLMYSMFYFSILMNVLPLRAQ